MRLIVILAMAACASAQTPGKLTIEGTIESIAEKLHNEYGLVISVEGPFCKLPADCDPAVKVDLTFEAAAGGHPANPAQFLQSVVDAANKQLPFAYRLDGDGRGFFIVPTRTLDAEKQPLLDRPVTFLPAKRKVSEHLQLLAEDLSQQTHLRISFAPMGKAGQRELSFSPEREPARSVMRRLGIAAWHTRCTPKACVIYPN